MHGVPSSDSSSAPRLIFALFESEARLLVGNASNVFVAPLRLGEDAPQGGERSPTIYWAGFTERDGEPTVDIIFEVAWRNGSAVDPALKGGAGHGYLAQFGTTFRGEYSVVFGVSASGEYGDGSVGAPLWSLKLRQATNAANTPGIYAGSSAASVPCGAGCADPRDRIDGRVDGLGGVIKLSIVAANAWSSGGTTTNQSLWLWIWNPLVKVGWLWPSGVGDPQAFPTTALGAAADYKMECPRCVFVPLNLSSGGAVDKSFSAPRVVVVPCTPPSRHQLCLWQGFTSATTGQVSIIKPLQLQGAALPPTQRYQRYRTNIPAHTSAGGQQVKPPLTHNYRRRHSRESERDLDLFSLSNDAYTVNITADGASFTVTTIRDEVQRQFQTTFYVVKTKDDPLLSDLQDHQKGTHLYSLADASPTYWESKHTTDMFTGFDGIEVRAIAVAPSGGGFVFQFAPQPGFRLQAGLSLASGHATPSLVWTLTAVNPGFWWTVGYVGAPAIPDVQAVPFAQYTSCFIRFNPPHNGTARCPFSQGSLLFPTSSANIPSAMVTDRNGNVAIALAVENPPFETCEPSKLNHPGKGFSSTCPTTKSCGGFSEPDACQNRGWATGAKAMLGVRRGSLAQPLVFAPPLGGWRSHVCDTNGTLSFSISIFLEGNTTPSDAYRSVSETVYSFKDERDQSATGALNAAFERMLDYLADVSQSNFQQWDSINKYSFYWMDQANAFKPLDVAAGAFVAAQADDMRLFRRFALQIILFSLRTVSKNHFLMPYRRDFGLNSATSLELGRPFAKPATLAAFYLLSGKRSPALLHYALEARRDGDTACPPHDGPGANEALAFLDAVEDAGRIKWYWQCCLSIANRFVVAGNQNAADPLSAEFLFSMWQRTHNESYRVAADLASRAREHKYRVSPPVTRESGETATFDKGNSTWSYWWSHGRWKQWGWPGGSSAMFTPQRVNVPAWRGSKRGTVVSGGGGGGGPLGTWFDGSPVGLLRAAAATNHSYPRALARASIIGRFGHFPGDFEGQPMRTLFAEQPDTAEHPLPYMTYTTWNTGHFWQGIASVADYLVADANDRSAGEIWFPSIIAPLNSGGVMHLPGLALRTSGSGNAGDGQLLRGRWMGDTNITLWMPSGLLTEVTNGQINWISGFNVLGTTAKTKNTVYVAFLSQSFVAETVNATLNPALIGGIETGTALSARMWTNGVASAVPFKVHNGVLTAITVPAKGFVALAIDGACAKPRLIRDMHDTAVQSLANPGSRVIIDSDDRMSPFGRVVGLGLSFGRDLTYAYVYTSANSTLMSDLVTKDPLRRSDIMVDSITLLGTTVLSASVGVQTNTSSSALRTNITATRFPFDFLIPMQPGALRFTWNFVATERSGKRHTGGPFSLVIAGGSK